MAELSDGTRFSPVLAPAPPSSAGPRPTRINLVSGKIYYELAKELQSRNLTADIELIRIEELCPFPFSELQAVLAPRLQQAKEAGTKLDICWVQEEAKNQGAFPHVGPRIQTLLDKMGSGKKLSYEGRKESAVPAVGVGKWHAAEHAALLESAMRVPQ